MCQTSSVICIPQILVFCSNLLLCLRKDTLRGALTNGHVWIFIIIVLNHDGKGAKYRWTSPIRFQWGMPVQIRKPWPDVLAGILLHWVSVQHIFLVPPFH